MPDPGTSSFAAGSPTAPVLDTAASLSPGAMPATRGPGTELKAILAGLGLNASPSCDCNDKALRMDQWGVAGCKERRDQIIGWLRDGQERWGWKDKLAIAAKAVTSGLAFKLNPLDPYPGLVDEAIRRAEEIGTFGFTEAAERAEAMPRDQS